MYELMVESSFSAAHQLRNYGGPCENLHGHTFRVQVFFRANQLNVLGLAMDFKQIKSVLAQVLSEFDHSYLNELEYFKEQNPTAENISRVIFEKMGPGIKLSKVTVWESATACASYLKGEQI